MRGAVDAGECFSKVGTLPDSVGVDAEVAKGRDIHRMVNRVDGDASRVVRARSKPATLPMIAVILRLEEPSRN